MPRLAITLLGGFSVASEGRPVTRFESDQVRALLTYLAASPGRAFARSGLADMLWPDHAEAAARANLRNTLSRLRHALGDHDAAQPLVLADARTVRLDPAAVACDAARFAGLADACAAHAHAQVEACAECAPRLREAALLYGGPLLAGASLSRSPLYDEWLLAARARLERQALEVFGALARAAEGAGDHGQLCHYARRQLEIEPWLEPAHRQLMLGLALAGDRGAAMAQYKLCRAALAGELGVEPDGETRALYERIRTGAPLPGAHGGDRETRGQEEAAAVAAVLNLDPEGDVVAALLQFLRDRRLLLIVDGGGQSAASPGVTARAVTTQCRLRPRRRRRGSTQLALSADYADYADGD
jgi:DNA-binding SARP family transcriptional activator